MTIKTKKRVTPPKGPVTSKTTAKSAMFCVSGPLRGHTLFLCSHSTLVMVIAGQKGRYVAGKWEAVCA